MLRQIKSPSHQVTKSPVKKDILLCLTSAALLILSFPKFNLEILAWLGFVPLLLALKDKSKLKAFFLAYITGVIFWLGIIYWLAHVTTAGMFILVFYLALYFGIFGFMVSSVSLRPSALGVLFIPSLWVILEYLRSHLFTGFPWALLGYAQYLNIALIQCADITGVWGVSFLVMMVNVAIKEIIRLRLEPAACRQKLVSKFLFLACGMWFVAYSYGIFRLNQSQEGDKFKISLVQANIPQHLKWHSGTEDFIINRYLKITTQVIADKPDLIIWPEAALPTVLEEEPFYFQKVSAFVKNIQIPLLLGSVTSAGQLYYNSALLISKGYDLGNKYDKLHLVPFGEFIPLRKILSFLEPVVPIGDFTAGKEYTVFNLNLAAKFSVLICFEDLFPELSRRFAQRQANFLINITNDAWFKDTSMPYQHLQASVFRAIENRMPLVRAANTGVSGFIDACGRIFSLVKDNRGKATFIEGYKTQEIYLAKGKPAFYTQYGDWFVFLCLSMLIFGVASPFKKRQ